LKKALKKSRLLRNEVNSSLARVGL
jgi:hypothetical protein